ncbi:hypothetical protein P0L94_03290 [Microbacter sp. GSS18]|nr:hypothetical protein P0L94_03290 [Microbacter sp. GSS18]
MRRKSRSTDTARDRGSAPIEFIFAGLVMLVPLVYLMVTLGAIQGQALGVETGARHMARAIATSADADDARARAAAVLGAVAREYGIDAEHVVVEMDCRPAAAVCPSAGRTLVVTVTGRVMLPLVPPVLGLERLASIPVEATAVQTVSRFWGRP